MPSSSDYSRRHFIRSLGGAAFTVGVLGSSAATYAAPRGGVLSVSCRDSHLQSTGLADSWSALKYLGADGIELGVDDELRCISLYHPQKKYSIATPEGIRELTADMRKHGLRINALCMSNHFDERPDRELAWTRALVAAAKKLKVQTIRIDVVPRAIKAEDFMPFAVKMCKQLCDVAKGSNVRYGIENHGHWTNRPEVLEQLFREVGSPRLGLTLDAMNLYWYGHPLRDVYGIVNSFADRVYHTHCKNLKYPEDKRDQKRPIGWEYDKHTVPLYEGDVDFLRITGILKKVHYRGDLCLENECLGHFPKEQHPGILKKEIALLRKLAAAG